MSELEKKIYSSSPIEYVELYVSFAPRLNVLKQCNVNCDEIFNPKCMDRILNLEGIYRMPQLIRDFSFFTIHIGCCVNWGPIA